MPVVRSFYGIKRVHPPIQTSVEQVTSTDHYFSHFVGNTSWTIIKYRLLSMPYVSKIKLYAPVIVLFIFALLSFIAITRRHSERFHPFFKTKPLHTGPVYLQNCLLLI